MFPLGASTYQRTTTVYGPQGLMSCSSNVGFTACREQAKGVTCISSAAGSAGR